MNESDQTTPEICGTASRKFETDPELLITRLSFSHLKEIMAIDDPLERFFYELECIKGVWSVRELRRQIDTKLFVRAGIRMAGSLDYRWWSTGTKFCRQCLQN